MPKPDTIVVPDLPLRSLPANFDARAFKFVSFMHLLEAYLNDSFDFTDDEAADAEASVATAGAGNASLTGLANRTLQISADGSGFELGSTVSGLFATDAEALAGVVSTKGMTPLLSKKVIQKVLSPPGTKVKLSRKTASNSANISFSTEFDSTLYTDYVFIIRNLVPATDKVKFMLEASDDNGSSFTTSESYVGSDTKIRNSANTGSTVPLGVSGEMFVFSLHQDTYCPSYSFWVYTREHSTYSTVRAIGGSYFQTPSQDSPINMFRFRFSSGNIASGDISLYGVKT